MDQLAFPPGSLLGRDRELSFLREFFRHASVTGGALLVSGEPGVGKTALVSALADSEAEAGATVVRVAGAQFEGELSFAALNQALLPLLDRPGDIDPGHRDALRVALGLGTGPAPERLLVSNAALALLRNAAARAPLLLVVDDLPWVDRASAGVLSFAARRLAGTGAGFLAACRTGAESYFDRGGLPEYQLKPLDDQAAAQLVSTRFPGLDPMVRSRVLDTARGNPLALLELPQALSDAQRSAMEPLPSVLPLGQRLQELFTIRVMRLPRATRMLLLVAALDGTGDVRVIEAAGGGDYGLDDLAPAERDHLVRGGEGSRLITFRHPLVRSAAVEASTLAERRRAHQALAAVLTGQPERMAWHLGEACAGPDEKVASLLESAAVSVARRGDSLGALARLTRAAELSLEAAGRGRRLAQAAYIGAESIGEMPSTAHLLESMRQTGTHGSNPMHYAPAATFVMLNGDGHLDAIHRLLVSAIEAGDHGYDIGDATLVNAVRSLALVSWHSGRAELWEPFHAIMRRLSPEPPALLALLADMFADPVRTGAAALPRLDAALRYALGHTDPHVIENVTASATYADRLAELREPLWRLVRSGRAGGPARKQVTALLDLCLDDFLRGEWGEAAELAAEGLQVSEERGGRFFGWFFRYVLAVLAAVQGRFATSRALANEVVGWAGPRGVGTADVWARHALVLADLGQGNFESAYQHASVMSPAGTLAPYAPHCLWVAMDLVEAAMRTRRRAEAEVHARVLREAGVAALSPRLAILVAASSAIAADDEHAPALFEEALSLPTTDQWPFDVARVRLACGERLRRLRATTESRPYLEAALTSFQKLGAVPWAARAELELRATGQVTTASRSPGAVALTPQELRIAGLAASGMSNKQIAQRLFLSPRTVGGHLYQIFPKLGITSRAALRDALGAPDNS
jgi:DNA-binding CsgD family transcriptional regulator